MDSLYVIQSDVTGAVKIGRSKNPVTRLATLQTASSYRLVLLASFEGKGNQEKLIQNSLCLFRMQGEWFRYECLQSLPPWIYEKLPFDDRWWMR